MRIFLSAITKNLNWEILTRIQFLLKDGMGLKMEHFNIMQVHWEGGHEKVIYRGELPKKGAWTVCRFKGGGLAEKRAMDFMQIISSHHVGFSYPAFFELV